MHLTQLSRQIKLAQLQPISEGVRVYQCTVARDNAYRSKPARLPRKPSHPCEKFVFASNTFYLVRFHFFLFFFLFLFDRTSKSLLSYNDHYRARHKMTNNRTFSNEPIIDYRILPSTISGKYGKVVFQLISENDNFFVYAAARSFLINTRARILRGHR